jgi:hypothetical protein
MLAPLLPDVEAEAAADAADEEDVAVSEVLEPLEVVVVEAAEPVELVVTVADVLEPAVEPTVAAVADELAVEPPEQYSVSGVMRSAYSANVPSVHSEGASVSSCESTDWQAVLVHMRAISASVGVASEVTV